ncbi:MAG: polysaccharide pyruvyl transferase family protein [Planctomycetota bacterium]
MIRDWLEKQPALADLALEAATLAAVEAARVRHAVSDREASWRPGEALKLLLVGYLGTRNTGADVRVAEMIRQIRWILGEDRVDLTALTSDARLSAGYFPGVRQLKLPDLYPAFLYGETAKHHGVVACEGSMFKSKFANALTTLMAGALGMAVAQNKLSLGYGAEAGAMDASLRAFVRRTCQGSYVVVRNRASADVLGELGVRSFLGTDTAWTFDPAPPTRARALLRAAGWDGEPVLVVCPINPFWWPVRPKAGRAVWDRLRGAASPTHYRSLYYHRFDDQDEQAFLRYLDALGTAVAPYRERAFVVLVGMERLDRRACELLSERLGGAPTFVSDEHPMFDLVAILREAKVLVSSRYHAHVCSMPAGVPAIGVSMDERIANLLAERDQSELCLTVDEPFLDERLGAALSALWADGEAVGRAARGAVAEHLVRLGAMGIAFEDELLRCYPAFPRLPRPRTWDAYLPPLPPALEGILEA